MNESEYTTTASVVAQDGKKYVGVLIVHARDRDGPSIKHDPLIKHRPSHSILGHLIRRSNGTTSKSQSDKQASAE